MSFSFKLPNKGGHFVHTSDHYPVQWDLLLNINSQSVKRAVEPFIYPRINWDNPDKCELQYSRLIDIVMFQPPFRLRSILSRLVVVSRRMVLESPFLVPSDGLYRE